MQNFRPPPAPLRTECPLQNLLLENSQSPQYLHKMQSDSSQGNKNGSIICEIVTLGRLLTFKFGRIKLTSHGVEKACFLSLSSQHYTQRADTVHIPQIPKKEKGGRRIQDNGWSRRSAAYQGLEGLTRGYGASLGIRRNCLTLLVVGGHEVHPSHIT